MPKYALLEEHLRSSGRANVPMTFEEIEDVIGLTLPPKASKHRAWWSNNPSNNVMTKAWLAAGYESTRVDMHNRKLVFCKASLEADLQPTQGTADNRGGSFSRIFGALKGTVTIAPGTDLTAPIGEGWDAER